MKEVEWKLLCANSDCVFDATFWLHLLNIDLEMPDIEFPMEIPRK